ncbi:hypothetical protein D0Y65_053403 [Glycine soja]|uniref:Myb/SANT-like DNA-binding domain-containing protein n=1 Tax=Glycine soja TaxID=3848 RepID=A0A445F1S7_GLYSO|nr:hypothetical protein D0Y65_053403 [Glycine soja]
MDPIVGDGQARNHFWMRVTKNYNNFLGELHERAMNQLKSRWQKNNMGVQKFKGHYKQAISLKKSGYTDNDVMLHAYAIWKEDEGSNFEFHIWAYSSSSNLETLVEDYEDDTSFPIVHLTGQKTTKRKSKGKGVGTSTNHVDFTGVEEAMRESNVLNASLAILREKELKNEYYEILMKDTSTMFESQLQDHHAFCKIVRRKPSIWY